MTTRCDAVVSRRVWLTIGLASALTACGGQTAAPRNNGGDGGQDAEGGQAGDAGGAAGGGDTVLPSEPGEGPNGFACAASGAPHSVGMRRLSNTQYRNTLRDLLTQSSLGANAIMAAIAEPLRLYPADARPPVPKDKHGAYRRMDQDLQDLHVEAAYKVAFAVATQMTKPANLGMLLGSCATDANTGNDEACIAGFVKSFGAKAFRRPLDESETAWFKGFYGENTGINAKAVADVIAGMLMAPRFLYVVEHGSDAIPGKANVFALDGYEMANRLSYQFWQTMPDQALFDAAAAGELTTPAGLGKQIDRMLKDPHARTTFDEFYADYLKLDDLPFIDKTEEFKYRAFAGADLPNATTRANVIEDVLAMTRYLTWDKSGGYDDLLLDEHSYATTDDVARLYGVSKWSGSGEPPKFAAGTRPGVLTRVGLLATGMVVTRPIMKGVFIRHNLLCDEIPPPPNNAQNATITQAVASTRTMVERVTQQAGSGCASCHATLINALGFATEGFDSLGRSRKEEIFYSGDTGLEVRRFPINTKAVPRITEGDEREAAGPADLAKFIVESKKANACFARHLFRFTFARWETLTDTDEVSPIDGCVLERVRKAAETKPLIDVFREMAMTAPFAQRTFAP
ncbi:MAG: DUF1592 domain-containing protein [Deltaproteobacteria bacterium]|nr:DUF1592 domain-containing protein [Deltaproteobacteria bacterium]